MKKIIFDRELIRSEIGEEVEFKWVFFQATDTLSRKSKWQGTYYVTRFAKRDLFDKIIILIKRN